MIIARIRGGLGNQIFQYAAARALAIKKQVPLKLDLYTYSKERGRKFELNNFQIRAEVATRDEVHQFTGSNFITRLINKQENYLRCPRVLAQPHYHFYEDFFSITTPVYLSGYWNSEKYFTSVESELREELKLKKPGSASLLKWKKEIENHTSISIHVRRGDYASDNQYGTFFGELPIEYYKQAVSEMMERIPNPKFFVFSDDIEWCEKNLSFILNPTFVKHESFESPVTDILLMAHCQNQIIANSTFSWWGAWLNARKNKVVIAPKQWLKNNYSKSTIPVYACRFYNTKDVLPESWIKL